MAFSSPAVAVQIVQDRYEQSIGLADTVYDEVKSFQDALADTVYAAPTISVQWESLAAPSLPQIPDLPDLPDTDFTEPAGEPTAFSGSIAPVDIDDFTTPAPSMNIGPAPTIAIGSAPVLPAVGEIAVPDAPTVNLPSVPDMLALQPVQAPLIDLHDGWLDRLEDVPELTLLPPAPIDYSPSGQYASHMLESLQARLQANLLGGTGIPDVVEQQIWDRARDRETAAALAAEEDVKRQAEALGYPLPSGVMAAQLAQARREYFDKISGLSRDIAIKQAELEQQNMQSAIQGAMQLEGAMMDDAYKREMLVFEASKAAADNAVAIHNATIEHFKGLLTGYQAYAATYDTIIKAELSKVELFRAQLSAEEAKVNINRALVERYKAEIDGALANVQVYSARVDAARTLVDMEKTKIEAGGERIKAFVATVNAETAKIDLYKAQVSAEETKQKAYGEQVRAYAAKVSAQAERVRANVAEFQGRVTAKQAEWDGWRYKLQSATTKAEIAARKSSIMIDGYRASAQAAEAQAASVMRRWEADIKQYEASKELTFRVQSANANATMHAYDARMEAAKVGLATASQQLASAWASVATSAGIRSSASDSFNYQM